MFTKKEKIYLLISILVLTFVFGFDDGAKSFVLEHWLLNFIRIFLFVLITILFREIIIKFFASRHDSVSEYNIWNVERIWLGSKGKLPRPLPFGIILSLILTFASLGKFFFTAVGIHNLTERRLSRVGRKLIRLNYFEEAQIVSIGIISNLFLAIISIIIGRFFNLNVSDFVNLNFYIVLFNIIPLSNLDGAKIFFGSVFLYIFILVFVVAAFLLIKFSIVFSLLVAFLAAVICVGIYFYKVNW